ncbi:amino acid ABC transporter permease [Aneurinibacillus terranovensis]|uniref:amino acid ABC transporter permease n=1 Tax=Aneurinibacillus terranovensis TaxID=278991 RepID=UPI000408FC3C|nr:amino acid ABC transporter permease [Aneurinibacillus terranovensis]
MSFDATIITRYWGDLFGGFLTTLYICITGLILGLIVGAITCWAKMRLPGLGARIMNVYIEIFRGTPFLIQTFIFYYVGPVFGINLSASAVGILGLAFYSGAYFAEIYRAGILSIPKGQVEAAHALGIGDKAILFRIILPQMLSLILAPLTNQVMTLIKESAILSVITVQELTFTGQEIIGETFNYVEVYAKVALLYWFLITILSILTSCWEKYTTRYLKIKERPKTFSRIAGSDKLERVS